MNHKLINSSSIKSLIKMIDDTIKNSFTPTLAFIYLSVKYDLEYLSKKLKKYPFVIVGATTVGEIYADEIHGVQVKDKSIVCMLVDFDKSTFRVNIKETKENDDYTLGLKMAQWSKKQFIHPALFILTSGLAFDNESYIKGLQTEVKHLFGASAGDDRLFKDTYVFSNKKLIRSGALVLAFNQDKIDIINSRGFGWSGIGTQRVVTKSIKNIVYTIDDKPAINFYKEYLNITEHDMPNMGVDYPLEVLLSNGQIIYRAAIHINEEEGSLLFAGHVKEGSKVRISAPIGELVIDEIENSINTVLKEKNQYAPDLTLIFPCAAHKAFLGKQSIKEIEAAYIASKSTPLIGFYAYGEISSSDSNNAFHNETFVAVQLREKS